jgi:glycosyltransferase involved in cell wall biosynthesis
MRIALFLPHVGVFGGVRRLIELGNAWTAGGHRVTLHHPGGQPPDWLPYFGETQSLEPARSSESDLAICADPATLEAFLEHRSGSHVYYCVIEGDPALARVLGEPRVRLAANSGALRRMLERRAGRPVLDGVGGINPRQFHPDAARRGSGLRVLLNGRRSRPKKGTDLILRALRGLERTHAPLEIVLFDTVSEQNRQDPRDGARLPAHARFVLNPTQEELVALYQSSHLFVAAERKAGWCNTALEAMACGCAVVCTRSGTQDFARHEQNALITPRFSWFVGRAVRRLLADAALRSRLAAAGPPTAEPWTWEKLARKLLDQIVEVRGGSGPRALNQRFGR